MTEVEWLLCADPHPMLVSLKGKDSDRKMRLFASACCRRVWHRLTDPRSQRAIEVAEQFAEGLATKKMCQEARQGAKTAMLESARGEDGEDAWALRGELVALAVADRVSASLLSWLFNEKAQRMNVTGVSTETAPQADLLRELIGNPFRPVSAQSRWLTSTAQSLAAGIYAERAFDRMPILADALEDAGCDNPDILTHCRGDGPHVRGCWVVDLLLGRE